MSLAAEPSAAAVARAFVARICAAWDLEVLRDELTLLTSELTTNALLHADGPLTVLVSLANGVVEVGVADHQPRSPVPRPQRTDLLADLDALTARPADEGLPPDDRQAGWHVGPAGAVTAGRGLQIVEAVSDEWGVAERADGKEVWFLLRAPHLEARACPCEPGGGFPVGSGRPVASP